MNWCILVEEPQKKPHPARAWAGRGPSVGRRGLGAAVAGGHLALRRYAGKVSAEFPALAEEPCRPLSGGSIAL
jgi:hypothetical protein